MPRPRQFIAICRILGPFLNRLLPLVDRPEEELALLRAQNDYQKALQTSPIKSPGLVFCPALDIMRKEMSPISTKVIESRACISQLPEGLQRRVINEMAE